MGEEVVGSEQFCCFYFLYKEGRKSTGNDDGYMEMKILNGYKSQWVGNGRRWW